MLSQKRFERFEVTWFEYKHFEQCVVYNIYSIEPCFHKAYWILWDFWLTRDCCTDKFSCQKRIKHCQLDTCHLLFQVAQHFSGCNIPHSLLIHHRVYPVVVVVVVYIMPWSVAADVYKTRKKKKQTFYNRKNVVNNLMNFDDWAKPKYYF
jgi:hypothetical protein